MGVYHVRHALRIGFAGGKRKGLSLSKRARREVETGGRRGFITAARRSIAAAGRRVADGDEVGLAELLSLQGDLNAAIQAAVDGIKAQGQSWAYIAAATGKTREAAYQKWGKK